MSIKHSHFDLFHGFEFMKTVIVFLVFVCTLIIASRALLHPDFFRTHDYVHGARVAEMTLALRDGHFPVRWTRNFGYGYGMPLFEFYAPLPYYFGSFVYWLTNDLLLSVKLLWLIPNILSFWGTYKFVTRHMGRLSGLIAAILFTLAPYRAVNLFVRGAISEVWAMSFFPVILYYIDKSLIEDHKNNWGKLTASWVGLFLSHNLMSLFFVPFSLLYALFSILTQVKSQKKKRKILQLSFFFSLSVGLSAFYIFPALLEKDFTQVNERILGGYFHYSQHFLYIRQFFQENWKYGGSQWGPKDDISFFLGYGQLFLFGVALVSGIYWILKIVQKKKSAFQMLLKHKIMFFGLIFLFLSTSLFLSLQKSQFLWNSIAVLQVAQFPWRFLALGSFFLAILVGSGFLFIRHNVIRLIVAVIAVLLTFITSWKYFQPEFFLDDTEALYYADEQRIQAEMSETLPDYIPKNLDRIFPPQLRVEVIGLEEERRNREVLIDRTHEMLIRTNFPSERKVIFNVADFPGWTVFVDGEKFKHLSRPEGFIEVAIPQGEHLTGLQFRPTPVRAVSDYISLVSLCILGYILVEFNFSMNKSSEKKKQL